MASETVTNLFDLLKEVWTQDRLERQFYNKNQWLDKVEKTNKYTIGREALVPLEKSLPGGTSTKSHTGGTLNPADPLHVDRAREFELRGSRSDRHSSLAARSARNAHPLLHRRLRSTRPFAATHAGQR